MADCTEFTFYSSLFCEIFKSVLFYSNPYWIRVSEQFTFFCHFWKISHIIKMLYTVQFFSSLLILR